MTTRILIRIVAGIGVAATLLWMAGAPAAATLAEAVLTPLPGEQEAGKPMAVAVRMNDATTGRPVGNAIIQFYVMTDVFGPRLMSIGEAVTDTTGRAAISYKPTWEGETAVTAKFAGNAQYSALEAKFSFRAVGPIPLHQDAKFGLEPIRAWAPLVVAILVVAVWAIIIGVVVHTVLGMSAQPVGGSVPVSGRQPQAVGQEYGDGAS